MFQFKPEYANPQWVNGRIALEKLTEDGESQFKLGLTMSIIDSKSILQILLLKRHLRTTIQKMISYKR